MCESFSWRRQTAQRLLVEHRGKSAAPVLREILLARDSDSSALVAALHALDQLGALSPDDLVPFIGHAKASVRIHALQLADRRFETAEARGLLDATLAAADAEKDPRVLIQFALSLGESRDPRAFALLAGIARKHSGARWVDAALLSSLQGRGAEMLAELLREPGESATLPASLAQSIAARRDDGGTGARAQPRDRGETRHAGDGAGLSFTHSRV